MKDRKKERKKEKRKKEKRKKKKEKRKKKKEKRKTVENRDVLKELKSYLKVCTFLCIDNGVLGIF